MLGVVSLCLVAAVAVVMSEIKNHPDMKDKIIGKRLPISWPRIEKNIGFQMCFRKCVAMSACLSINFNRLLLECELNDRKKQDLNELTDDDSYIYAETIRTDHFSNICGEEICNNYSTCITMQGSIKVCIETDCRESAPDIINGQIVHRTYSPASITYECKPDYIDYGSITTTNCYSGGKWSSIDYRCGLNSTRLVGSNASFEGRVEVYLNGTWGTVCDDRFEMSDANVVCRSLGYQGVLEVRTRAAFGAGVGEILMDDVNCISNETSILDCAYRNSTSHDCHHSEDVGVVCEH